MHSYVPRDGSQSEWAALQCRKCRGTPLGHGQAESSNGWFGWLIFVLLVAAFGAHYWLGA